MSKLQELDDKLEAERFSFQDANIHLSSDNPWLTIIKTIQDLETKRKEYIIDLLRDVWERDIAGHLMYVIQFFTDGRIFVHTDSFDTKSSIVQFIGCNEYDLERKSVKMVIDEKASSPTVNIILMEVGQQEMFDE